MDTQKVLQIFGEKVKALRTELGISEYELAKAIDESVFYVRQVEQAQFDPTITDIAKICSALKTTSEVLFKPLNAWL